MGKKKERIGESFDVFLEEEGLREEATELALKRVIAWQVEEAMKAAEFTKKEMAARMKTSRSSLDRLLDGAGGSLNLRTLERAARALGKRVELQLVDGE